MMILSVVSHCHSHRLLAALMATIFHDRNFKYFYILSQFILSKKLFVISIFVSLGSFLTNIKYRTQKIILNQSGIDTPSKMCPPDKISLPSHNHLTDHVQKSYSQQTSSVEATFYFKTILASNIV